MRLYDLEPEQDAPPRNARHDHFAQVLVGVGLGVVGADETGRLTEVSLDGRVLRVMSQDSVARYLVEAVNAVQDAVHHRLVEQRRQQWPGTK
ncbi:hypothetical protein [Actinophytocola xinjiangensis]|nr:hypothetical protein [Actinophytocola xinjiangensis]